MNKCFLLLKIQLMNLFGINRIIYTGNKKEKRRMLALGGVITILAVMFAFYSAATSYGLIQLGLTNTIPAFILIICALITIITVFIKSSGVLFGFKDYDMIMSLPVGVPAIITSRTLAVYLLNFAFSCVFMIPSFIIYAVVSNSPASVWIMLLLSLFLSPLLPMVIALTLGALITAVSIRFRQKSIISVILAITFIFAFYTSMFNLSPMDNTELAALGEIVAGSISSSYPLAIPFSNAINYNNIMSFLFFTICSVVPSATFIALLSIFYKKINSALFSYKLKSNYSVTSLKTSTPFKAFYFKELRRFLSCSTYMLNSGIGAVLLIGFGAGVMLLDFKEILATLDSSQMPLIASFFIVISSTSASSVSLEGKSRWIPSSLPINMKTIFNAKIAVNLTVLIPSAIIGSTLLSFKFGFGLYDAFLMLVLPIAYSFFISIVGLAVNLKFPKYDWNSEYQAVKQSASILVSLGIGFASVILPIIITLVMPGYTPAILTATAVAVIVLSWIIYMKIRSVNL